MIDVVLGDIAQASAAAILRPVSAEWDPVTPAMRRLELAAGPSLREQCQRLGELPVGSAAITGAGGLSAEFVIHAIVRSIGEQVTEAGVQRALQNGLRRCVEWGIDELALPPVGTGAGNLDPDAAASLMIPLLLEHIRAAGYPSRVQLVVENPYELEAFQRELQHYDLPTFPAGPDSAD